MCKVSGMGERPGKNAKPGLPFTPQIRLSVFLLLSLAFFWLSLVFFSFLWFSLAFVGFLWVSVTFFGFILALFWLFLAFFRRSSGFLFGFLGLSWVYLAFFGFLLGFFCFPWLSFVS